MKHHCAVAWAYSSKKELPTTTLLEILKKQIHRGQDAVGIFLQNSQITFSYKSAQKNLFENLPHKLPADFKPDIFIGHLRYQTFGKENSRNIQPYILKKQNLVATLSGNFNITNIGELARVLQQENIPFNPDADAEILLKFILRFYSPKSFNLTDALKHIDGGFFLVITINRNSYLIRDPNGIRPAFYTSHNNILFAASEPFPLWDSLKIPPRNIREIPKGHFLSVTPQSSLLLPYNTSEKFTPCSLEKIYFSSRKNPEIKKLRQALGMELAREFANKIPENALLCYVPRSAKDAFTGFSQEIKQLKKIPFPEVLVIQKKSPERTFIATPSQRLHLTRSIYSVAPINLQGKTLVCIEDSIIRGNTLKTLLPRLLALNPEKILVLSASPVFKFPDFYGIDIASLEELVAFQALRALLQKNLQKHFPQELYVGVSREKLLSEINTLVSPAPARTEIGFLSLAGLKRVLGKETGSWYFDGKYPTKGGQKLLAVAFQKALEGDFRRAYSL